MLLDVSATVEGRAHQLATVARLRGGLSIPLTAGGGVTQVEDALALLEAGADKVSVNTAAVRAPALLDALAARFRTPWPPLRLQLPPHSTVRDLLDHTTDRH